MPSYAEASAADRAARPENASGSWLAPISLVALAAGTTSIALFSMLEGSAAIAVGFALFGVVGAAAVWRVGRTGLRIYTTVYGFAALAAVALYQVFVATYGNGYWVGGSDELMYEEVGAAFAESYGFLEYGAIRGGLVQEWHNSVGYIYLVGVLAKLSGLVGGFHTMVPRLFNGACLALLAVLVYLTGMRLQLRRRTAIASALFAGCLPLMLWSAVQTLRDVPVALLILLAVFLWLPDAQGRWRQTVPVLISLSLLLVVPIWEMRTAQAYVLVVVVAGCLFLNRRSWHVGSLILSTAPMAVAAAMLLSRYSDLLSRGVLQFVGDIEIYTELRGAGGTGGGLSRVVFESPLLPAGWLYRTLYALVSPLPVEYSPIYKAWLSIGTIVHLLFLPYLWIGIRQALLRSAWLGILLAFSGLFLGMAMFTFTGRHIQYLPFAILLAALGYEYYRGDRWKLMAGMAGLGGSLGILYLALVTL